MQIGNSDDPPKAPLVVQGVPYDPRRGLISDWDDGTVLRIDVLESPPKTILISGNPPGLTSLARHLLTVAQPSAPPGSHLDFDDYCGWFEEGSFGVRIELEQKD
ncbi:Imm32 family immunity protein [Polymorphospora rubra]|uniref:Imm32 family immunity protein n=1 Tax=Polymorphospora rubra TaxID=338584 RepID=UPI003F4D169C